MNTNVKIGILRTLVDYMSAHYEESVGDRIYLKVKTHLGWFNVFTEEEACKVLVRCKTENRGWGTCG